MSQHLLQVGLRELCCSRWVRPQTWRGPAPAAASSPAEPRTTQWMLRRLPITQRNQGCSNYSSLCRAPVCRDAPQRLQGAVSGMQAPPSKRQKEGFWPEPPCLLVGGLNKRRPQTAPARCAGRKSPVTLQAEKGRTSRATTPAAAGPGGPGCGPPSSDDTEQQRRVVRSSRTPG